MNLLWDVDGTLLTTRGGARSILQEAFYIHYGRRPLDLPSFAGMTDMGIYELMKKSTGIDKNDAPDYFAVYHRLLEDPAYSLKAELFPGVLPVLERARELSYSQYLLTGNTPLGARKKIEGAGVRNFFKDGFYGDWTPHRPDIVKKADEALDGPSVIIGDAIGDIIAGREAGIPVVSVGTGGASLDELRAHNKYVLESFSGDGARKFFEILNYLNAAR